MWTYNPFERELLAQSRYEKQAASGLFFILPEHC
jgi:hypothetical protein